MLLEFASDQSKLECFVTTLVKGAMDKASFNVPFQWWYKKVCNLPFIVSQWSYGNEDDQSESGDDDDNDDVATAAVGVVDAVAVAAAGAADDNTDADKLDDDDYLMLLEFTWEQFIVSTLNKDAMATVGSTGLFNGGGEYNLPFIMSPNILLSTAWTSVLSIELLGTTRTHRFDNRCTFRYNFDSGHELHTFGVNVMFAKLSPVIDDMMRAHNNRLRLLCNPCRGLADVCSTYVPPATE